MYVYKINLETVVEGGLKAAFSIATTPRCRERRYSFSWIAPPYPWYVPYNVSVKYHFLSLWYDSTWDWTPICGALGEHSTHWVLNSIIKSFEKSVKDKDRF